MSIALVTGAGRGIGYEVARQLAHQGMTVLVSGRDTTHIADAASRLKSDGDVRPLVLDVTDDNSARLAAEEVQRDFGVLDVLVNNAGVYVDPSEATSTTNLASAHAVFETNLFGPWRTIEVFLPLLHKSDHGRIVNVSSGAGSHGDPAFGLTTTQGGAASYAVSKAALTALTAKLAVELQDTQIIANAVCPGFTATFPGAEQMGAQPVAAGAAGVVWAATLPDDGPRGGLFRHGEPLPW